MVKLKLKEYMERNGISVKLVSEQTGIRYATVLAILNQNNTKINMKYLAQILDALCITDMNLIFEYDLNESQDYNEAL